MANTFTSWNNPAIQGAVLAPLRQVCVLPRLVYNVPGNTVAERGQSIDISKTVAATARSITSAVTPAANQDISPTKVTLTLDQWYEATYHIDDKEDRELRDGVVTMQLQEAIKAIGNQISSDCVQQMNAFAYDTRGTPGTTPFSSTSITVLAVCRRILNQQLAPMQDRRVVIDPLADAAAITVGDLLRFDGRGPQMVQIDGQIGDVFGMATFMDQMIATQTASTTSWVTGYSYATGGAAAGATTITVINATQGGVINAGYLFTSAGSSQVYSVFATTTSVTNTNVALVITPALATAVVSADAITVVAAYTPNLVFHRNAFAFASRPLSSAFGLDDSVSIVDPATGVALRLLRTREYYQDTVRVSCLWGRKMLRSEHVVRLAG